MHMPKGRGAAEGGSRTPTTAESDGGLEETEELESNQELMGMHMVDPMGWNQPHAGGFPSGVAGQPVWGGMPFYQGGFAPAPYGGGNYPGFFRGPPMGSQQE